MPTTKAQQKAVQKYQAKAYERIYLKVKTGEKEKIESHAKSKDESTNGFITRAINETIERDNGG